MWIYLARNFLESLLALILNHSLQHLPEFNPRTYRTNVQNSNSHEYLKVTCFARYVWHLERNCWYATLPMCVMSHASTVEDRML